MEENLSKKDILVIETVKLYSNLNCIKDMDINIDDQITLIKNLSNVINNYKDKLKNDIIEEKEMKK